MTMAKKARTESVELHPEEQASLDGVDIVGLTEEVEPLVKGGGEEEFPDRASPDWHNYAMSHFQPDELDGDGNPYVFGLRRVGRKLLGPPLQSVSRVVQGPQLLADGRLGPAVVEHLLVFEYEQYSDCADVWAGNTNPTFAIFPTALAATRAEGRAWRKALNLKRVIAAEESSGIIPAEEAETNGLIGPGFIKLLDASCKRNDVNLLKFIAEAKGKYTRVEDVPISVGQAMCRELAAYHRGAKAIPDRVKGYDPNWRN
jgi:hypothetical protein